jgi:hypothetical protein
LELLSVGRIDFNRWGLQADEIKINQFVASHPLAEKRSIGKLSVVGNSVVADPSSQGGYLAAIISDYLRREWLRTGVSFTFRTYFYYICTEFDNPGKKHRMFAEFEDARLKQVSVDPPRWFSSAKH